MRFFHLSDLHIGKQLNGYSLRASQEQALEQIVTWAESIRPDAILISGDIYDKTAPSGEAYTLFGHFLERLAAIRPQICVLLIAGNHDSPERLSYAGSFLEKENIYIAAFPPVKQGQHIKRIRMEDEYGPVNFYLLPFLKPGYVRGILGKGDACTYEEAVRGILEREEIDDSERNVILSHQFYTGGGKGPETCDSEQAVRFAGGLDQVSASVLEKFDYAALGHLHKMQQAGAPYIRYCGSPCKYSVSEESHQKSVTVVTLGEKGQDPELEFLPLKSIPDVRRIKGTLQQILDEAKEETRHDFVSITVTEEDEPYRIREKLEEVFDHILELRLQSGHTWEAGEEGEEELPIQSPAEVFSLFYETVRKEPLDQRQTRLLEKIILEAKEEEEH